MRGLHVEPGDMPEDEDPEAIQAGVRAVTEGTGGLDDPGRIDPSS